MSSDFGTLVDHETFRIERTLPGPMERVWRYLTEPESRGRWLAGGTLDPREGGELILRFDHDVISDEAGETPERFCSSEGPESVCRIVTWDPPHELSYTWPEEEGESLVHFALSKLDDAEGEGQVLLVLTQSRLATDELMRGVSAGWHAHLDILADRLAGRPTGNFWQRFEALEEPYARLLAG